MNSVKVEISAASFNKLTSHNRELRVHSELVENFSHSTSRFYLGRVIHTYRNSIQNIPYVSNTLGSTTNLSKFVEVKIARLGPIFEKLVYLVVECILQLSNIFDLIKAS